MNGGDRYGDGGASIRNLLLQLHSLAAVTSLASQDQPDMVVFARPDLLYHNPINPDVIHHVLRHPRVCAIPGWQWFHGCNDRFAICGREAAGAYGTRGMILAEYCRQSSKPLSSEGLLRFALLRAGISIVALPLRASRVRLGGKIRPEQFTGCCWRRPGPQLHLWRARLAHALIRRHRSES